MTRSYRLLAERGPLAQGIVSLGPYEEDPSAAEVFGLYVVPDARGTRVSWRLVEAAAALGNQAGLPAARRLGGDRQWRERSASVRISGSAPPATAAPRGALTANGAMRRLRFGDVVGARRQRQRRTPRAGGQSTGEGPLN